MVQQTGSDIEADAFYASLTNPDPETVARIRAEGQATGFDSIEALEQARVEARAARFWAIWDPRTPAEHHLTREQKAVRHREAVARRAAQVAARAVVRKAAAAEARAARDAARAADASVRRVRGHEEGAAAFWVRVTASGNRERVAVRARRAYVENYRALLAGRDHGPLTPAEVAALDVARAGGRRPMAKAERLARAANQVRRMPRGQVHPAGMSEERALEIDIAVWDGLPPQARW